ncbi:transposable element Tc3 transposase [Trichonephila clavipes]|nr:transposable element Tc3 transposase [Trichonephila clavipes]
MISRMDWPAYSPDFNPIEPARDMLGRRIAARQPPPTCLPELRRALLDEWCNIPQDQIDNLILSLPRRSNVQIIKCTYKIDSVAIDLSTRPKLTGIIPDTAFLHVLHRRPIGYPDSRRRS